MTTPPTAAACLSCGTTGGTRHSRTYLRPWRGRGLCKACYHAHRAGATIDQFTSSRPAWQFFTGIPDGHTPVLKDSPEQPGLAPCAYTSTEITTQCDHSTGRYAPWHYSSPFAPTQAELDAESNTGRAA